MSVRPSVRPQQAGVISKLRIVRDAMHKTDILRRYRPRYAYALRGKNRLSRVPRWGSSRDATRNPSWPGGCIGKGEVENDNLSCDFSWLYLSSAFYCTLNIHSIVSYRSVPYGKVREGEIEIRRVDLSYYVYIR